MTAATYDLQFTLYDETGNPIPGATILREDVPVTSGTFTVSLDFGAAAFSGAARTLLIEVRRGTETGAYTPLTPRQPITSSPYAIQSLNAVTATTATNATNATNAQTANTATTAVNVTGVVAIANGGTGSTAQNFVDLTTAQTVGGAKTFGDTVAAPTFEATTGYNIGGNRVLSITGDLNLFAGVNAGLRNTTGNRNSFVGSEAGRRNSTGGYNSYFGFSAGSGSLELATGSNNSFFGAQAGGSNETGGNNSFVGVQAGFSNISGSNNTLVGGFSRVTQSFLTFASAFGAYARVDQNDTIVIGKIAGNYFNPQNGVNESRPADTVRMPGSLVVSGALQFSAFAPGFVVPVANGGTGSQTRNFVDLTSSETIGGNKTFTGTVSANAVNSQTGYNIGGYRILSGNPSITSSLLVGYRAGENNTGGDNTFLGNSAGENNTSGAGNTFVGIRAGTGGTNGNNNTMIGNNARYFGSDGLEYATVIGAGATVSTSNSVVLGRNGGQDTVRIPGNLVVTGSITGASKNFKIDYPLDPQNKTLTYTAIESPDMMNVYNGNITTNERGEATVLMPEYFEVLNRDFRYQLTVIGQFAQAIVLEKIKGNRFVIKTDKPNVEVSWQITGIRQDKFAEDNRIPNVQEKPANEKGKCLYAPACEETLINPVPLGRMP